MRLEAGKVDAAGVGLEGEYDQNGLHTYVKFSIINKYRRRERGRRG